MDAVADGTGQPQDTTGVAFRLLDAVVGVSTPTSDLAASVRRLIPEYAEPLAASKLDDLLRLREVDDGWSVETEGARHIPVLTLNQALEAIEYLVSVRLLSLSARTPQLHAAGAVASGNAILALGDAGAGKTSVAVCWSRRGHRVLGDDVVLLDEQGFAMPFKRLFRVSREMLPRLGVEPDPAFPLSADEDHARYDPGSDAAWAAQPAPIRVVALIRHQPDADVHFKELAKPEALTLLTSSLMPTGAPATDCFEQLASIAAAARAIELTFGSADEAAAALTDLV